MRLSKRTGDIITLDEMLDEVGPDVARLTYLLQSRRHAARRSTSTLVAAQTNENPVFYVQYAHARIRSLARVAAEAGHRAAPARPTVDLAPLIHERELDVLRALAELPARWSSWPPASGRRTRSPPGCRELAGAFHGFYHDCRVMGEGIDADDHPGPAVAGRGVPQSGWRVALDLLGVSAPETM